MISAGHSLSIQVLAFLVKEVVFEVEVEDKSQNGSSRVIDCSAPRSRIWGTINIVIICETSEYTTLLMNGHDMMTCQDISYMFLILVFLSSSSS
jgi:hypothetical protein